MKILLSIFADTAEAGDVSIAYLGRVFGWRMRPLTLREASERLRALRSARFVELELPKILHLGDLPVVSDPDLPPTCLIIATNGQPTSILCLRCGAWSHNPNDVLNAYCARCHVYHQERHL